MPLLVQTVGTGKRNRFPTAEVDVPGRQGAGLGVAAAPDQAAQQLRPARLRQPRVRDGDGGRVDEQRRVAVHGEPRGPAEILPPAQTSPTSSRYSKWYREVSALLLRHNPRLSINARRLHQVVVRLPTLAFPNDRRHS
jgi:hypothetical protein